MTATPVPLALNFYQLLNVLPTATPEQIDQAYQDRKIQQPWAEFSPAILEARQSLIAQAHHTLTDPKERSSYDQRLTSEAPSVSLAAEGLIAGLLLLLEVGETMTVLEHSMRLESPEARLVQVLAHRDYAGELIQQNKATQAVAQLHKAQELLTGQNVSGIWAKDLQDRLRKARPGWILELVTHPDPEQRTLGITQFAQMLTERKGIEGDGQDGSRLNRDQLFQFIQALLPGLDVQEQVDLFTPEAERPSVGASYLLAQALIAQGFATANPPLIRRARGYLVRLGQRRDVALELAVCAVLLGQVEEAEKCLGRSLDQAALASIRRLSTGAPDLLPGLCQYAQDWLTQQLFMQTRDLQGRGISLNQYFAQAQPNLDPSDAPAPVVETPKPTAPKPLRDDTIPVFAPRPRKRGFPVVWGALGLGGGALAYWLWQYPPSLALPFSWPTIPSVPTVTVPTDPAPPPPTVSSSVPPEPEPVTVDPVPVPLDEVEALIVIQAWQGAKQAAMGEKHDLAPLATILSPAQQQSWTQRAKALAQAKSYWRYTREDLAILKVVPQGLDQGEVTARIREAGVFYEQGQRNRQRSYQKTYTVRYTLVRVADRWVIQEMRL